MVQVCCEVSGPVGPRAADVAGGWGRMPMHNPPPEIRRLTGRCGTSCRRGRIAGRTSKLCRGNALPVGVARFGDRAGGRETGSDGMPDVADDPVAELFELPFGM